MGTIYDSHATLLIAMPLAVTSVLTVLLYMPRVKIRKFCLAAQSNTQTFFLMLRKLLLLFINVQHSVIKTVRLLWKPLRDPKRGATANLEVRFLVFGFLSNQQYTD